MRLPLKVVALGFAALVASAAQGDVPCLKYEPEVVQLVGTMKRHTFPGPPEYESVAKGDRPEVFWVLHLAKPICVERPPSARSDPNDPNYPETNVRSLQIVFVNEGKSYNAYRALLGKRVIITGTLYHQVNVHHRTTVLIIPTAIEAPP